VVVVLASFSSLAFMADFKPRMPSPIPLPSMGSFLEQGKSENNQQMHRLKQSFQHTGSFDRVRQSRDRVSKNAGAAFRNQIQRLPRFQGRACNNQKPRRTESASTASWLTRLNRRGGRH
jgi:hypothetical protein